EVGYARRRVEWYERLIADEQAAPGSTGTPVDELREGLAGARARLAEVETEAPGQAPLPRNRRCAEEASEAANLYAVKVGGFRRLLAAARTRPDQRGTRCIHPPPVGPGGPSRPSRCSR